MKKRPPRFMGLDVSKDQRDIACRPERTRWSVANDSPRHGRVPHPTAPAEAHADRVRSDWGLAVRLGGHPRRRQAACCRGEPAPSP
jgi:hypothetical protein